MNNARILVGNRIAHGPIHARRRALITIICDGRLMTGLPVPRARRKQK